MHKSQESGVGNLLRECSRDKCGRFLTVAPLFLLETYAVEFATEDSEHTERSSRKLCDLAVLCG